MKKIAHYFETPKGAAVKNLIVCMGAAVVLLGALFKITHWPGATVMLIVGMLTEAALFAMFGLLPPHKEYHWEKFYPGLDVSPHLEHDLEGHEFDEDGEGHDVAGAFDSGLGEDASLTDELDKALESAEIGPELIENLGSNLNKLGEGLDSLGNLADVGAATEQFKDKAVSAASALENTGQQFSEKASEVTSSMDSMKDAYQDASNAVQGLGSFANEVGGAYQEQMNSLTNNIGALNEMYELELQTGNTTLKSIGEFRNNISEVMSNLEQSAEDTKVYREQVAQLAQNLSALNQVYGNMLNAMSAGIQQPS